MADLETNIKYQEYATLEDMCFKLREIEHFKSRANKWDLRLQFIESHMIFVAASGQGWLTIDGQFTELRQGSVYVFAPGQLVEAAAHSFDERGFYYMRFDVMDDDGSSIHSMQIIKRNSPFPAQGEVIVTSPVSVNSMCETICQLLQDEDRLKRFRGQILFQEMLYTILQDARLVQGNDLEVVLEYVKGYIEQHYQQELSIDHLAKVAGLSTRHFMRLFKKKVWL